MDHTDYEITLIRSRRKSLAIGITPELQVVVRAPARMPVREINAFVQEKDDWIHAHLQQMAEKSSTGNRHFLRRSFRNLPRRQ